MERKEQFSIITECGELLVTLSKGNEDCDLAVMEMLRRLSDLYDSLDE